MYNIEKINTDNVPILDELVYNLKKAALNSVVKDQEEADKYETVDSIRSADIYLACIEQRANFHMFKFTYEDLQSVGVPDYIMIECINDNTKIPEKFRNALTNNAIPKYINSYNELNNYYRKLNGLPNIGQKGLKIPQEYIPKEINIDTTKYVHEMSKTDLDLLFAFNIIDKLLEEFPEHQYLKYTGSRKISIYQARIANKFELLYIQDDIPKEVLNRFKDKYELNRVYTLKVVYNEAFKLGSDYYENFIAMFIMVQTIIDILCELPDFIIKKELFDIRTIELLFLSNGVDFFPEIPMKYQLAMIKNINTLIKYKSTNKNIVDICSLFGFENIEVFKYYLLKDRKVDKMGNFEFNYSKDENGNDILEDINNYDLKFIKVPIDDNADDYLHQKNNILDYDEVVVDDIYWNGDLPHEIVKKSIIDREFNYLQSKYLSIDTIYSLTELSFQMTYFYNMLFDDVKLEEQLTLKIPSININVEFKFIDIICYLYSLMYEYNGLEDSIMDTQTKVLSIRGFNFKANMAELATYVKEQGFTMEELGVDNFIIPEKAILSYNQLMHIFTNNKKIYDHIVKQLYNADNKKIYDIYKKLYDSLMVMELNMEFFRKKDGTIATSYTDFIHDRDIILYNSLTAIQNTKKEELKKQRITEVINDCIYVMEQYIDSEDYKFIFSNLPTVSAEAIKGYIFKVINFFKSYKVDILGINTIYKFDDKLENKITMIDRVIFDYIYNKEDVIDLIEKLYNKSILTKEDRIQIIEQIYKEVTYWVELLCEDSIDLEEKIKEIKISLYKEDSSEITEEKEIKCKVRKILYLDFIEKYNLVSKINKKEIILMKDEMFIDPTFWKSLMSISLIKMNEKFTLNSNFHFNEEKYELYANTELLCEINHKDNISIEENIKFNSYND